MLAELKEILNNLEKTEMYKKWRASHKDAFLSSFFIVDEQGWQLAFYSPETKRISTFLNNILVQADSAIFKLEHEKVQPLNLDEIKLDLDSARKIADKELENNHPGYKKIKEIIVLQKLSRIIWNITYLTASFYIFNIKIDAITGKIVSQDFISAMYQNPKKNPNLP